MNNVKNSSYVNLAIHERITPNHRKVVGLVVDPKMEEWVTLDEKFSKEKKSTLLRHVTERKQQSSVWLKEIFTYPADNKLANLHWTQLFLRLVRVIAFNWKHILSKIGYVKNFRPYFQPVCTHCNVPDYRIVLAQSSVVWKTLDGLTFGEIKFY